MDDKCTVREATIEDLDSIVNTVLLTMPHDPQWNWRFAHKDKFPDDHYKYTRLLYEQFISSDNDDWQVILAETTAPADNAGDIVGFAVWDVSFFNKSKHGPSYKPQNPMAVVAAAGGSTRRDVEPRRQAAFRISGNNEKQHFFDDIWGDKQIHLQILGVHPDHWRQKIGSKLVGWGIRKAAMEDLPVTLIAGSLGLSLYLALGFRTLGKCVTQAVGEDEKIDDYPMVYAPAVIANSAGRI